MKEQKYAGFNIYKVPETPTECGKYVGKTPILEQALTVCDKAKEAGKSYFVKGVCVDGSEVIIL